MIISAGGKIPEVTRLDFIDAFLASTKLDGQLEVAVPFLLQGVEHNIGPATQTSQFLQLQVLKLFT